VIPAIPFPTLSDHPLPDAHHYGLLPKAFELPAARSTPSCEDKAPVSFRPPQTGEHGCAIHSFAEFRADPLFSRSQQEILGRLDELASTARGWRTRNGDETVDKLQRFRHTLQRGIDPLLGPALPVIHGAGKRGLDEFCALMREAAIDERAKRCALIELATELVGCGPRMGSGLSRAPETLLLAQGGLHAEMFRRTQEIIDQSLKQAYCELGGHGEAMESHAVLQLRRELGLPGGELEDLFATRQCVSHAMIARARRLVEDRIAPAALAYQMAVDVLQELRATICQTHGDDLTHFDPMGEHAKAVGFDVNDLNLRYGGIRLASVVVPRDEDCTSGALATDPSLVALDLLEKMAQSGLAPEPRIHPIVTWTHDGGETSLSHVDSGIFFLEHRSSSRRDAERAPLTLDCLARLPTPGAPMATERLRAPGQPLDPWRERLAAMLIDALPRDKLVDFPREWLTNDTLTTALLTRMTRMTPSQRDVWIAKGPLPEAMANVVAGMVEPAPEDREQALIRNLRQALTAPDAGPLSAALQQFHDRPALLAELLRSQDPSTLNALRRVMSKGDEPCTALLVSAVNVLAGEQHLTPPTEKRLLRDAMVDTALMHPNVFPAWLLAVDAAVKGGRMSARAAFKIVTRRPLGNYPAGAMRGWVVLVSQARRLGVIDRDLGLNILRTSHPDASVRGSSDFRQNRSGRRELLDGYVEAAQGGDISPAELQGLLREMADAIPQLMA
jgi:hypothetical protein